VVAHERTHVLRGDVRANLAVAALRCLHWFNPLLHAAATRFRLDQELACDATVLAHHPHARRAYADAMLNTQLAVPGLPVGCHWQSSQSLKERILMLKQPQPGAWRRRVGAVVLCAVLAGSSYAAWALRPASDAAPAYRGFVEEQGIAIANVHIPKGMGAELWGPTMARAPGMDSTNVMLDPHLDLRIESTNARDPWRVRVKAAGTAFDPKVTWSLERNGRVERETILPVAAGAPTTIDLSMLADAQGRVPTLAFLRLPADRIIETDAYAGVDGRSLSRDADGAYRQGDPIHTFSTNYKADGDAVLLVGVGVDGRVQTIDIESMKPAGALTGAEADQLVRRNVYKPQIVNGKPVPTRIRVPVQFARAVAPVLPVPAASPSLGTMTGAAERTPAPRYPAVAAANKVGGKVVLILDVAADGSVSHVSVEKSEPAGVFDAAAIEAAGKWTLKPTMEDGKPVAGRVRVPITFSPDGMGESPTGMRDNARPGLAG
jgi:bla regulator protein blaR1